MQGCHLKRTEMCISGLLSILHIFFVFLCFFFFSYYHVLCSPPSCNTSVCDMSSTDTPAKGGRRDNLHPRSQLAGVSPTKRKSPEPEEHIYSQIAGKTNEYAEVPPKKIMRTNEEPDAYSAVAPRPVPPRPVQTTSKPSNSVDRATNQGRLQILPPSPPLPPPPPSLSLSLSLSLVGVWSAWSFCLICLSLSLSLSSPLPCA